MHGRKGSWTQTGIAISVLCLCLGLCYGAWWSQTLEGKLQKFESGIKWPVAPPPKPYRYQPGGVLEQPGGQRLDVPNVKSPPAVYPKVISHGANSKSIAQ